MRPDQIARIVELSESLADTFITNADPKQWTCGGRPPAELTQQERGDAYWCRKMAMATGGVLRYTLDLVANHANGSQPDEDGDLDKQIQRAEKEAAKLLDKVTGAARKAAFDKRTHGKAPS